MNKIFLPEVWGTLSRKVLASVLVDDGAVIPVSDIIGTHQSWFAPKERPIWQAIRQCLDCNTPPTVEAVATRVNGNVEAGYIQVIANLFNDADNRHLIYNTQQLREIGILASARQVGRELAEIEKPESVGEDVSRAVNELNGLLASKSNRSPLAGDVSDVAWQQIQDFQDSGIKTGLKWFDDLTGGLWPGMNYWIVAAYKSGKTTVMRNAVLNTASAGGGVGVFCEGSREMFTLDCQAMLATAILADQGLRGTDLRLDGLFIKRCYWRNGVMNPQELAAIRQAIEVWKHLPIYLWDALTERRLAWQMNRKNISYIDQCNQLKPIREFDAAAAFVNYTSIQQTLRKLDKAFDAFFRRVKAGEKPGFPRYKGKGWWKSIRYAYGDGVRLKCDRLYIQRVGDVRMFQHRPLPNGTIKQVVIKRDNLGNWYAIFQVELPNVEPLTTPTQSVGIDMGLKYFAALSTGELIDNPRWFRVSESKLAKLQKMRSRCKKGSCRYKELTHQIRNLHQRIASQRLDFHHKLSRRLVDEYGVIFVEKLNIDSLCQSHVSKSMRDAGWGQFLLMLSYKSENDGGERAEVDARRTSQLCPMCGCAVEKSLSIRVHHCLNCSYIVPRDVAASQIIELRGLMARTEPSRKVLPSFDGSAKAPL